MKLILMAVLSYFTGSHLAAVIIAIKDKDYMCAFTSSVAGSVILFFLWVAVIYDAF